MAQDSGAALQGSIARSAAEFQKAFADTALPSIKEAAGLLLNDLNPGGPPSSVSAAFGTARSTMTANFEADKKRAAAGVNQEALQSGLNYSPAAVSEVQEGLRRQIESDQGQRMRALNFEEANVGMNQTNRLIASLLQTGSQTAQGSIGFGNNANFGASLLSQIQGRNRSQNSTYGSIAGTVVGGAIGYFAGNPFLGASLGGAAGGAIGGML